MSVLGADLDEKIDRLVEKEGDEIALKPPDTSPSLLGAWKRYRHEKKAERLARKGYVRWYKLGSTVPRPKWVKPSKEGTGVPRYMEGDDVYYFPPEAMLPDQQTGAWTAIHFEGEADPVNLRDRYMPAIEADLAGAVLNMEAESEAPGWLSGLNITPQTIMWGMIGLILVVGVSAQVMGAM